MLGDRPMNRKRIAPEEAQIIRDLRKAGHSQRDIAKMTSRSSSTIAEVCGETTRERQLERAPRLRASGRKTAADEPARKIPKPPVRDDGFIRPPTLAQLMSGKA